MSDKPILKLRIVKLKLVENGINLFRLQIGKVVNDYLNREFPILLDYDFTNQLENSLDRISRGEVAWHKIVKRVYNIFRERIDLFGRNKAVGKAGIRTNT